MITTDVVGEVLVITMDRPEKLNAWTPAMAEALASAIEGGNADPAIGAMVLTGAGRGFCAGADMEESLSAEGRGCRRPSALTPGEWGRFRRTSCRSRSRVDRARSDERWKRRQRSTPQGRRSPAPAARALIKVGLVPELASTHLLVQRMGIGRAGELCLSGRVLLADEALASGLVDRVVPPDELLDTAITVAAAMGENAAPQLRMIKQLLTLNGSDTDPRAVQDRESAMLRECWASPEHAEAVQAFLEKRPPVFPPRS